MRTSESERQLPIRNIRHGGQFAKPLLHCDLDGIAVLFFRRMIFMAASHDFPGFGLKNPTIAGKETDVSLAT